jgi:hypothetical protein
MQRGAGSARPRPGLYVHDHHVSKRESDFPISAGKKPGQPWIALVRPRAISKSPTAGTSMASMAKP